jgi:hypothetical protein
MQVFKTAVVLALCAVTCSVGAQTVTVGKTGTPRYSTVQEAIDSFISDRDPAPNVVQIIDGAVYEEVLDVYLSVTVEGTGPERPVLAAMAHADTFKDGISVWPKYGFSNTTRTMVLKNLVIIPSLTAPPKNAVSADGQYLQFEMDNVLITANNGSNGPVSTDGLTRANMDGAVSFSGVGLFLRGSSLNSSAVLKNTVVTHMLSASPAYQDGLHMYQQEPMPCRILGGCVFSFCGRLGIAGAGSLEIDAATTKCLVINNYGFAGIWFSNGGGKRSINGAIVANNAGFGIEHQNGLGTRLVLSNSIFANNRSDNVRISEVGTDGDITLTNVTIGKTVNAAASPIYIDPASDADIFVTDCIIAGNGTTSSVNTVMHKGTGTMHLAGVALVTEGPQAMVSPIGGTGPVDGSPTTTADPYFLNTTDVISTDYFDVTNNAYADASSAGGPLAGGADFVGGSGVADWSVY